LFVSGERLRKQAAKPLESRHAWEIGGEAAWIGRCAETGVGGIWARYKEDEFEYVMLYRERWKIFDAAPHGEGK
jgi:hypothetical protein